ncbi:hypothetical protein [Saccharopolyspora hattusasensis]|uniref:hypothetical protein n=1 Tax=Saccharopolyspora hattusasensis TaxID=1128679 RepID=UPI003D98F5CC
MHPAILGYRAAALALSHETYRRIDLPAHSSPDSLISCIRIPCSGEQGFTRLRRHDQKVNTSEFRDVENLIADHYTLRIRDARH